MDKKIGIIVGSIRTGSFNRMVANYVATLFPGDYQIKFIEIRDVDMFNQDLEATPPKSWTLLREEIRSCDSFLFFTPEYNRSIPGVLKNALDVGSRPYGENSWNGKPAGIISVSMGNISGFGANHHLRQVMTFLNLYAMPQPEAYIGNVMNILDDKGNLVNLDTQNFLKKFVAEYINWCNKF